MSSREKGHFKSNVVISRKTKERTRLEKSKKKVKGKECGGLLTYRGFCKALFGLTGRKPSLLLQGTVAAEYQPPVEAIHGVHFNQF